MAGDENMAPVESERAEVPPTAKRARQQSDQPVTYPRNFAGKKFFARANGILWQYNVDIMLYFSQHYNYTSRRHTLYTLYYNAYPYPLQRGTVRTCLSTQRDSARHRMSRCPAERP